MTGRPLPPPACPENEQVIINELQRRIRWRGDQTRLAQQLGVSSARLSHILRDGHRVSDRIAEGLGFRRVYRWERIE